LGGLGAALRGGFLCNYCDHPEVVEDTVVLGDAGSQSSHDPPRPPSPPMRMRRELSVVAAGHAAAGGHAICKVDPEEGKPATILKVLDENEHDVYARLQGEYASDHVGDFIPTFHGVVEEHDENGKPCRFIRINNLLHHFRLPKVMDVKLGTRTFLEAECKSMKLRPDLFKRMLTLYPAELNDADHQAQAITKFRFMQARDANTTIGTLGYRIDGIAGYKAKSRKEVDAQLTDFKTFEDTCRAFHNFAEVSATDDGEAEENADPFEIAEGIHGELSRLRDAAEDSEFVREHEFIGSSVLIVADSSGQIGVFWIDFAKTCTLAEDDQITHRAMWKMGNHEDGILFGLDKLIEAWEWVMKTILRGRELTSLSMSSVVAEKSFKLVHVGLVRNGLVRDRSSLQTVMTEPIGRIWRRKPSITVTDDLAVLSSLPAFSGVIADREGTIWEGGIALARARLAGAVAAGARVAESAAAGVLSKSALVSGAVASGTAAAVGVAASGVAVAGSALKQSAPWSNVQTCGSGSTTSVLSERGLPPAG